MKSYPNFSANLRYALSGICQDDSLEIILHGGSDYKKERDEVKRVRTYIEKYKAINSFEFEYHFKHEKSTFQKSGIPSGFLGITKTGEIFLQEEAFLEAITQFF